MGYGRSKLVAERITYAAMKQLGVVSRVLRIGQLAGDTVNAVWNDTEAIALMVRSVLPESAGCLPELDEVVSWLPVDSAAEVIEELVFRGSNGGDGVAMDDELVYHILNPRTFSFKKDLIPMLQAHPDVPKFEVVPVQTWLERLRASEGDVRKNPSRKLMEFWEGKYGSIPDQEVLKEDVVQKDEEAGTLGKGLTFETRRTVSDSECLGRVRDPVSDGLMSRIVGVWMAKWRGELKTLGSETI